MIYTHLSINLSAKILSLTLFAIFAKIFFFIWKYLQVEYFVICIFWCTPLIHINLIKNEDEEGKINILQFIKIRNILNSPFTAPLLPLFLVSLVKPWAWWNSLFSTYWPTRPAVFFRFIYFRHCSVLFEYTARTMFV